MSPAGTYFNGAKFLPVAKLERDRCAENLVSKFSNFFASSLQNKLDPFSPTSLSNLVKYLRVRPEPTKVGCPPPPTVLPAKLDQAEKAFRDIRSTLFGLFVSDEKKDNV